MPLDSGPHAAFLDLDDVAACELFGAPGDEPPALLIEIPHGATEQEQFDSLRAQLRGALPDDLAAFFHVNTDVGAPELGRAIARELAARGRSTLVVRCLLPRTFVDTNRCLAPGTPPGMSAGIPSYVADPTDRALLGELHATYLAAVERAYEAVCGSGGLALALHTYAPRSVEAEIDADIVASLRRAYQPALFRTWPLRPEVDLITATPEGEELAPPGLPEATAAALEDVWIESGRNATYTLHPATQGLLFSRRYPRRVFCLEARRDLLGAPWRPFAPTRIGPRKALRLARPIASALSSFLPAR